MTVSLVTMAIRSTTAPFFASVDKNCLKPLYNGHGSFVFILKPCCISTFIIKQDIHSWRKMPNVSQWSFPLFTGDLRSYAAQKMMTNRWSSLTLWLSMKMPSVNNSSMLSQWQHTLLCKLEVISSQFMLFFSSINIFWGQTITILSHGHSLWLI